MKSIAEGHDVEIVTLHDIPKDAQYAKACAKRILQNKEMYSIYKKMYEYKEQETEESLAACVRGQESTVFADTKVQNGCCRVGQTKIFNTNYPFFSKYAHELRKKWLQDAQSSFAAKSQVDFHLHMISTIAGADEVYSGHIGGWKHKDEMWIWIPSTQQARERLVNFLNAFHSTSTVQNNQMTVEFPGKNREELDLIFEQNFPSAIRKAVDEGKAEGLPIAIIRFEAGSINSRKAQITPYLPRFIS
jgi:hypothetical protein